MNIFHIPTPSQYLNLTTTKEEFIEAKLIVNGLLITRIGP